MADDAAPIFLGEGRIDLRGHYGEDLVELGEVDAQCEVLPPCLEFGGLTFLHVPVVLVVGEELGHPGSRCDPVIDGSDRWLPLKALVADGKEIVQGPDIDSLRSPLHHLVAHKELPVGVVVLRVRVLEVVPADLEDLVGDPFHLLPLAAHLLLPPALELLLALPLELELSLS